MFSKMLVPLDVTRDAETALPLAETLARQLDAEIVLLAVVPDDASLAPMLGHYDEVLARMRETRRVAARTYLDRIRERLLRDGLPASAEIRDGLIAKTIVEAAGNTGAGLIVMATHGRMGPERWFLGSVADEVVRTAEVPVLLVRPAESGAAPAGAPTDILVPLDGSSFAERALPVATGLAAAFKAPITLVRTVPTGWWSTDGGVYSGLPEVIEAVEAEAREYLEATAGKLKAEGLEVATKFALFAAPDLELEVLANAAQRPLVVMTSHGRSGLGRVVLGSVADRVVRGSSAPVLVMRGEERS